MLNSDDEDHEVYASDHEAGSIESPARSSSPESHSRTTSEYSVSPEIPVVGLDDDSTHEDADMDVDEGHKDDLSKKASGAEKEGGAPPAVNGDDAVEY